MMLLLAVLLGISLHLRLGLKLASSCFEGFGRVLGLMIRSLTLDATQVERSA